MACITIDISVEKLQKLQQLAYSNNVSTEELLLASIEEWLTFPNQDFSEATEYVMRKNAELYRRLA